MKTILLCAGRGSRLLPLTLQLPKCLVPVEGKAILDHQIDAFREAGMGDITIVGGFGAEVIADHVARMPAAGRPELVLNPFWSLTSSIASLWFTRHLMDGAFCIANGDTIFSAEILKAGLGSARIGMNLLVEQASARPDDMLVAAEDGRIAAVGKTLDPATARYRSLGVMLSPSGGSGYRRVLEEIIMEDGGPAQFHHQVLHRLAEREPVHAIEVGGEWTEIDSPQDIKDWALRNR